ncbi:MULTISPECIES: LysR family transcriptional regulator [Novosphingobium]|uniref:LysR family transcriptional regulator n=1 Tax=Novosphingobium TaxID=165696 RepID=UPI0022F29513|nr:LysR family transcriptional regulator [Novosphingobium resinovorum]GLK43942.1 LysR family transcriptional regulator [Novosphingobium resinovorum]
MQVSDWNDYQTFLAIAREGQMARAARSMGIDATTAGRRLRRLEARMGQILFEQTREGQVLTEAGEALLAHVETMALAAGSIASLATSGGGPAGTLRISVSEGFASWFLAPRLSAFADLYPNIIVDLVASSSYLNLSRREADMAIYLSRPQAGPLVARKLTPYRLGLYASDRYLAEHGVPADLGELTAHRLVGYIPDLLTAPELRYADEIHPQLKVSLRSSSINSQYAMVSGGAGIGILPCFIGDVAPGLSRIVPECSLERAFWLVTHRETQQLAKVRAFGAWLQAVLDGGGAARLVGR